MIFSACAWYEERLTAKQAGSILTLAVTSARPSTLAKSNRHRGSTPRIPILAAKLVCGRTDYCGIAFGTDSMLKTFTTHEVDVMRRDAKRRSRVANVTLAKILDQIAIENGYRNWSLLQKSGCIPADQPQPYRYRRTSEDVSLALRAVPESRSRLEYRPRSDIARDSVQALDDKFASAANAVEFAIAYVEGILAQPRYRLDPKSLAYWEMRFWLPYGAELVENDSFVLINRYYKPVGRVSREWVDYSQFPHLIVRLPGESWRVFSHPKAEQLFLFADASAPWHSRDNASAYLIRLRALQKFV